MTLTVPAYGYFVNGAPVSREAYEAAMARRFCACRLPYADPSWVKAWFKGVTPAGMCSGDCTASLDTRHAAGESGFSSGRADNPVGGPQGMESRIGAGRAVIPQTHAQGVIHLDSPPPSGRE